MRGSIWISCLGSAYQLFSHSISLRLPLTLFLVTISERAAPSLPHPHVIIDRALWACAQACACAAHMLHSSHAHAPHACCVCTALSFCPYHRLGAVKRLRGIASATPSTLRPGTSRAGTEKSRSIGRRHAEGALGRRREEVSAHLGATLFILPSESATLVQ